MEADKWCEMVGGWVVVRDEPVYFVVCVWFDEHVALYVALVCFDGCGEHFTYV